MDAYEKGRVLGTGTFATVFLATHKSTGRLVAVKKINITDGKEGVHVTALREMKLLRELQHPHVISLLDVFPIKKNIGLVLEFMESDLEAVIKARDRVLSPADIKSYMSMLLQGLQACHSHWVVHRDVKPNNCLLAPDGSLKLADFGLARHLGSPQRDVTRPYTHQVFARWYRAPELFYGASSYGFAVDMWAAGCVFAELLLRRPWLPGSSDIDQLGKTFQALGTPSEDNWPGVTSLPCYMEFTPVAAPPLRAQFPHAPDDALALLAQLVSLDPAKRPSAEQALAHSYFSSAPDPTPPALLPRLKQAATHGPRATALAGMPTNGSQPAEPSHLISSAAAAAAVAISQAAALARRPETGGGPGEGSSPAMKRARAEGVPGQGPGLPASPGWAPDAAGKFSPPVGTTVRT